MGDLLIRNIPEALKREIEISADSQQQSLSAQAIDLLRKGLVAERETHPATGDSAWNVLRSIFEADGPPDGEFAKIMDEIEAERKRDFGRPVDFGLDGEAAGDDRS